MGKRIILQPFLDLATTDWMDSTTCGLEHGWRWRGSALFFVDAFIKLRTEGVTGGLHRARHFPLVLITYRNPHAYSATFALDAGMEPYVMRGRQMTAATLNPPNGHRMRFQVRWRVHRGPVARRGASMTVCIGPVLDHPLPTTTN